MARVLRELLCLIVAWNQHSRRVTTGANTENAGQPLLTSTADLISVQRFPRKHLFNQDVILQLQVITLPIEISEYFASIFPGEFAFLGQIEAETELGFTENA
jgi:hypothetical protein